MSFILSEYLKKKRKENNMSQRQLAKISGVSNSEISKIEGGIRKSPNPETLKKLGEALTINYSILAEKCGYIVDESKKIDYFNGDVIIKTIEDVSELEKRKYLETNKKLLVKVVDILNSKLNLKFQIEYKVSNNLHFDAIAFNKYNEVFCIDVNYINTSYSNYFIESIINKYKSKCLDYYMYFSSKDIYSKIYFEAVIVLDNMDYIEEIEQRFRKEIKLINSIFSYRVFLYDELIDME
ncbi:helix-turn-helix domain-containing protein [Clostridium thermobutyricum]|nr:helix-turn-helix transcriptional regulator [Clostridium thermobutyricum]